jgi:hypothetical protein
MIKNFTKVKPFRHDNFIRLFKRVMNDSELTPLQKIILSDVISLQIQGNRYFKTSKALAKELGNVAMKTIQDNFQKLNKMGYLDTIPFKASSEETHSLREAIVIDIEKWTSDEDTYTRSNLKTKKRVPKDKDHPLRMAWPNRYRKDKSLSTEPPIFNSDEKKENMEASTPIQKNDLPMISYEQLNHCTTIRDAVRRKIRKGTVPNFFEAKVDFEDGTGATITNVVKVADRSYPKQNHMPQWFIYDKWSPDDPSSLEDDLLDDLENLD